MADITQMIRWNTQFVRGLAQTILNRARIIRSSLAPHQAEETKSMTKPSKQSQKTTRSRKPSSPAKGAVRVAKRRSAAATKSKRANVQ